MKLTKWMLVGLALVALLAWGCGDKEEAPAETAATETPAEGGDEAAGPKVDINTATVEQLDELKGVSPKVAKAIVAHRDKNGAFADVDALNDVPGISDALLAKLKPLVTCGTEVAPPAAGGEGEGENVAEGGEGAAAGELVNLNTATQQELDAVNGIGAATAKKIIAYREEQPFTSVDQLKDAGVSAMTISKIRDLVTCGPAGSSSSSRSGSSSTRRASSSSDDEGNAADEESSAEKKNLNTATAAQIKAAVPGIRANVMTAIIDARNELPRKKFRSWDQVDDVDGVGSGMLTKLKAAFVLK